VENVNRITRQQLVSAQFPIFAYNIGSHKLVLLNTLSKGSQYVFHIEKDQEFVCFVEKFDLKSLGFFQGSLRIETCSQIVYLTLNKDKQVYTVNIMLVDPYYFPVKLVLFKSSKHFGMNLHNLKCHDMIYKVIIFSTAKNEKDENYDVKLLVQYQNHYTISTMKQLEDDPNKPINKDFYEKQDYLKAQKLENEEISENCDHEIYPINMILDPNKGNIFYVKYVDGICQIKEIIPRRSEFKDHLTIFEIKADLCLGFSISDNG
jgi:predicted nucleotidyltransferase